MIVLWYHCAFPYNQDQDHVKIFPEHYKMGTLNSEIKSKYNVYCIQQNFGMTSMIALRNMVRHNTPPHYFVNRIATKGSRQ
jgi:hypothetical protein